MMRMTTLLKTDRACVGLLAAWLLIAGNLKTSDGVTQDTCTNENLEITCAADEVIVMTSAEYGRKEVGRCITKHDEYIGCTNDVLGLLDKWCSGRTSCQVAVPNVDLDAANKECLEILRFYLEATYECRKVIQKNQGCQPGTKETISDQLGVISSHVTDETGCGSPRSPWIIKANPGQTIDLTLLDFSAADSDGRTSFVTCQRSYGFILERSLGINHTICGGNTRQGVLYHSKTNTIEINLIQKSRRTDDAKFLVEFTAVGCPDLTPPPRAWYKREGNEAVISCETNDQEWQLTCTGNTWQGSVGNCSTEPVVVAVKEKQLLEAEEFPVSTLVITTSIIGGAVIVTVAAIMCGVIHMKKYKIKQERRRLELQINYATVDRRTFAPNHGPTVKEGNLICMEPHTQPNIPNPATENEPIWKSPLPDPHENDTSYPAQCAGATLPGHAVSADRWNNLQEQAPLQGSTLGPKYCPLDN